MITGLNKFGESLGEINFIELQWNRKYTECGSFVLYMAARDYMGEIKYVKNSGRPETGLVQKVEYEKESNGDFVTLSGFFIDKMADGGAYMFAVDMAQWTGVSSKNRIESYLSWTLSRARIYPNGSKFNLYDWTVDRGSVLPAVIDANIEAGTETGKALYNMLQPSNGSYYCTPIFNTNKSSENALPLLGLNFVFIKGKNLQDTVYFGDAFNNVDNIMYTLDESAEKPLYHILQEVPGDSWNEGTVADMVSGEWKYWLEDWLRVDGNRPDDMGFCFPEQVFFSQVDGYELIPENEAKIRNQMKLQAQLDMLNRYKVESIEVSVLQNRFYYLKDYDLGDVCSVSIDEIQQMFTARIVEVKEVHSDNKVDVEIVLGTPQKTQWKKVL